MFSLLISWAAVGSSPSTVKAEVQANCALPGQEFGVQESHVLWGNQSLSNIEIMLDRTQAGGLTRLRLNVEWQIAEPTRGEWDATYLSKLDSVLALMQERSIEPIVILLTTPPWARNEDEKRCWSGPDPRDWAIPPRDPADYANAIGYLAARYAGRIRTWEIWNEPNLCDFWNTATGPDPIQYTAMLTAAYTAIKAVDTNIVVLGGALAGNDSDYLQDMYTAGVSGYFDALSIHPYSDPPDPGWRGCERWSFAAVPCMEQTMADLGEPNKPIWITEMGWSTQHGVTDATRAEYFRRVVQMVRSWPYVKVFIAYYLQVHKGTPEDGYELWVNDNPTETWNAYTDAVKIYSDILPSNPFYPFVNCLTCGGIMGGYSDGTFRPGNDVTRGQLAKIVSNAAGFDEIYDTQTFEDLPLNHTFYLYAERMVRRGIITGYPCGGSGEPCGVGSKPYFRPNDNATRGQVSKIVSNAVGFGDVEGEQVFEDVPSSQPFYTWVQRLALRGFISGYDCGGVAEPCGTGNKPYFRPSNSTTRGQISKIVSNSFFPDCNVSW